MGAPVVSDVAGGGQGAFLASLVRLGFVAKPPERLGPHVLAGEPVLVNGWQRGYEPLARECPGRVHVVWHSGWTGSDLLDEGKVLARVLDLARDGAIRLLWLEARDVLPEGAISLAPVWSPAELSAQAPEHPTTRDRAIVVGLHGLWPSMAKNIVAQVAAAACVSRATGARLHVGSRTLGASARGDVLRALLAGLPVRYHGVLDRRGVTSVLAGSSVLLHASLSEAWPFLASEAVYAGCPAVISETVPWAELLSPWAQDHCVVRPAKASARIRDLALAIVEDDALRARLAAEQRATLDAIAPIHAAQAIAQLRACGFDVQEPV